MFASNHGYSDLRSYEGTLSDSQSSYFKTANSKLFSLTPEVEHFSVSQSESFSSSNVDFFLKHFSTVQAYEPQGLLDALYNQYVEGYKDTFRCYRKTDIIFPFHYHW